MPRALLAPVAVWLCFGLVEVWLAWGALARPSVAQIATELGACAVAGLVWGRLAPAGVARSFALPAVVAVAVSALLLGPRAWVTGFVFAVGVAALAGVTLRVVEERLAPGPLAGAVLAALAAVVVRYQVLQVADVADARAQLLTELTEPWPRTPTPASDGPPVVLISVDTLRWDHAVEMVSWQRVAQAGAGWPRAMATSSWTLPSMASVVTGLPAQSHGAGAWPGGRYTALPEDVPVLAEQLADQGYATAAFLTNPFLSRGMGFDRGVDLFLQHHERAAHRLLFTGRPWGAHAWQSEVVVDRALAWLAGAPKRGFFLWVHVVDPHLPYQHAPAGNPGAAWRSADIRAGLLFTPPQREAIREGYANEVRHVDGQLGRLLDALEARGVLEDGVVAFVADHGEELWDHGGVEHGHSHHGEVVDVAVAIAAPGLQARGPEGVVSLADVAPTLQAAAGLAPGGHDLREPVPIGRIATAVGNKYDRIDLSARQGDVRLIRRGDGTSMAYDLRVDPGEQAPLEEAPEALEVALDGVVIRSQEGAAGVNVEGLRALGYLD
ncbi:MAG: sulfatase [Alphaproteobacteria bacterium]|nr:sulfatase [Alphaproteobacteria bacterium]